MSEPNSPRRLRLVSWRRLVKNSLRGFATVELPIGLTISDIPVLAGKNGAWAALPSKPQVGPDGAQRRDINGKPLYVPILEWRDRELSKRFSAAVIALIHEANPDAFGEDGAS
jgi:hypothetical protein